MKTKKISLSVKISAIVMAVSFIGISVLAYLSYRQANSIFTEYTSQILRKNIEKLESEILEAIARVENNVELLAYNKDIAGFFRALENPYSYDEVNNKTVKQYKREISNLFKLTLKLNSPYFQIRILDKNGLELIKIVREKNRILEVPSSELQNKSRMSYFINSIRMFEDSVYISKINLNKEFGTVEFPLKPTIRVIKLIYLNNVLKGMLIINADVSQLFNFDRLRQNKDEITYIANSEGYYIFNQLEPFKEFGFEFGYEYKIYEDFPELKKLYNDANIRELSFFMLDRGQIYHAKKVFLDNGDYLVILKRTSTKTFQKKSLMYINTILGYILLITLLITVLTIIMVRKLTYPIDKLTRVANHIAKTKGRDYVKIDIKTGDEIEELSKSFEIMLKSLIDSQKELEKFAEKLEKEVENKTKELKILNENLKKEVEKQVKELREKDKALVQQSKLAAMGEMIGAIAHQWRQPLNYIALNVQLLEELAKDNKLDKKTLEEISKKILNTIQFMSKTIDDFRSFFRKDREQTIFDLKDAVENTVELLKPQLENHNIKVIEKLTPVKVKGFKNEFRQVVLNLITNARDAIEERKKKENIKGVIEIELSKEDGYAVLKIKDNGVGIPDNIKNRIFEPYFTTKEDGKGTGLGLYMVKEILSRMGGSITFHTSSDGTEFIIRVKTYDGE